MVSNNNNSNPNGLNPKRRRSHAGLNHPRNQHHPCRCCDPQWSCTGGAEWTDSGSASASHPIPLRSQRAVSQGPLARVQLHNTILSHTHTHTHTTHTHTTHSPSTANPNPSSSSSSCCCCSSSSAFPPVTPARLWTSKTLRTHTCPAWHHHHFTPLLLLLPKLKYCNSFSFTKIKQN